jgi:hypothetical protein
MGSNLTRNMDDYVYSVFVLPCAENGLAASWSPVQGVLPALYNAKTSELIISKWEQARERNSWG